MEDKLRAYMDHLFRDVKPTKKSVELKEEILQNLVDKYQDLLGEGKSPEAAYNIAVASIGDMEDLLAGLRKEELEVSSLDNEQIEQGRKKSAILISVSVMLYIMSLLPPILLSGTSYSDRLAPALMFLTIAIATGLIIYNHLSRPRYYKKDDSIVEEFKEWQEQTDSSRRARKAISSALWSVVVAVYILISFWTMSWHITWVIFLIGAAIEGIIKAIFELKR